MYTIIVADDEEELRKAIIRKIHWEELGFQMIGEAENGIEALELVTRLAPDVLLTDIRMPFISGIELARQIREVRPATQIIFLSGYDDFTYAQQAIQYNIISYLLKPITMAELTDNLKKIKIKIDGLFLDFAAKQKTENEMTDFLMPLLLDGFHTEMTREREERLRKEAEGCGLLKPGSHSLRFVVTSILLKDQDGRNCTQKYHVHSIDIILKKYVKYSSFYVEGRIISVLTATQSAFEKYLHILSEDIVQSTRRILSLHCCLGVSREVETLSGLHEACRESGNAMRYANRSDRNVHYIADEEPFGGVDMDFVMNAAAELENRIRTGGREELEAYIRDLFTRAEQNYRSRRTVSFLMVELLSGACRILYAASDEGGAKQLRDHAFIQQMRFLDSTLQEAEEQFICFCESVRQRISENKKQSSQDACEKALRRIEEDFASPDISLVSISGEIGVSPNYLSGLIKKRTGKSFIDYLTLKRMEEAKRLLTDTTLKIREISEQCGYSDQHYFSYSFKKYTGVSPNMLRQQLNGETL